MRTYFRHWGQLIFVGYMYVNENLNETWNEDIFEILTGCINLPISYYYYKNMDSIIGFIKINLN